LKLYYICTEYEPNLDTKVWRHCSKMYTCPHNCFGCGFCTFYLQLYQKMLSYF